jgi:hypothetical protein
MHQIDWANIDKSDWGKRPDPEIAATLGVTEHVIAYWRKKFGIPSYDEHFLAERERRFNQGEHWCSTCKSFRPIGDFGKYHKGRYGLRPECTPCRKQERETNQERDARRRRERYERDGEKIRVRNRASYYKNPAPRLAHEKRKLADAKRLFVNLAGGCCQRCGYSEFMSGMEFHHVDPKQKDSTPVVVIKSGDYDRAYAELDKCALLCRNCHQAYHTGEWTAQFVKRDGLGWTIQK